MSSFRRACTVLLAVGLLGGVSLWQSAQGQKIAVAAMPPQPPGVGPAKLTAAISLPIDSKAQRNMERVRALIEGEEWADAVKDLQQLLDRKEDGYVKLTEKTGDNEDVVSCRYEAARLIGSLPVEGLKFYEDLSGAIATAKLAEVKKSENMGEKRRILREIIQSYTHTKAGAKAVEMLATDCLELGEYQEAALRFKQLLNFKNNDAPSSLTLLKACLAFSRVDDKTINREEIQRTLLEQAKRDGGVRIGDQLVSVDQINDALSRGGDLVQRNQAEWPITRGNPSRTAQGVGSAPHLEPQWAVSTLPEKSDHKAWVEDYLRQAVAHLESRGVAIMPGFHPIAIGGKVIFRTYDGFYLVNLREPNPDYRNMWQSTDGGAQAILGDPNKKQAMDPWKTQYLQTGPHGILFENSVTGTLTTDAVRAFLVDDLILPPNSAYQFRNFGPAVRPQYGHLNDQSYRNSLKAYNLESFKLIWDLGGKTPSGNAKLDEVLGLIDKDGKPLTGNQPGSFFMGPPLPLNGKLYALNERGNELRLLCLEPKDKESDKVPPPPDLVWSQTLVTTRDGIESDINRRIHAAHLAYGEGMLICPTNAGAILGVDLLTHSLVWVHKYREGKIEEPKMNPNGLPPGFDINGRPLPSTSLINEWKSSPPAIVEGKVLFAAPDGNALHCLDLHRGKLLWKANRADSDLYFAGVYNGNAVIVGKNNVRAININQSNLTTLKESWNIANTGLPSGQGVASDNIYYLPVKASVKTKEPEIVAIDTVKGTIHAQTPAKTKKPDGKLQEPGNLIFYEGQVISQTLTSLISYPQVNAKMAASDELLKKNPRDPKGLVERGELRLGKGELSGAIADLHLAMEVLGPNPGADDLKPLVPRVRTKLYDSLTQLFDRDFESAEKYLEEYKDLCKTDNAEEQLARYGDYWSRLAKGRETQGRLLDAFEAYMEFGKLVGDRKLVRVSDQPNTDARPDVWARGRIGAMMAKASPEKRKPLEEKIAEQWKSLQDTDDIDKLENFVALFGSAFEVGKQAKFRLAEKLMNDPRGDRVQDSQLRSQLLLLQLRELRHHADDKDKLIAAQAVEALARLMIQKNEMSHAATYYKELGRDFAKTVIRDGKTGGDLYNEIVVDKRFLPFLEAPRPAWKGNFKASEQNGNFQMQPAFTLEPTGEVLPFFERNRLTLETNGGQLRIIEQATGDTRWTTPSLPISHYFNNFIHGRGISGSQSTRFTYSAQGHVVVMSVGHMVYAFDPVEKRKLWEYNLYKPGTGEQPNLAQVVRDRDGNYQLLYVDGWIQRLGTVGPVAPSYVCLQTREGLIALDPVKGPTAVLWKKADISPKSQIFGDDEYIFVVDVNGEGKPTNASKAVRAVDGVLVNIPDFAELYNHKLSIRGRTILAQDETAKNEVVLRLYDAFAGKDIWSKTFPAKSVMLRSEQGDLVGVVDPEGAVSVFDIRAQKEVFKTNVKKDDLAKLTEAHLLADRDLVYIILNQPAEQIQGIQGGLLSNIHPTMSSLAVNGPIYAFDRSNGKMRWCNTVTNEQMLLEQFDSSPVLLFTVKYAKLENMRIWRQVQVIECIAKDTGKFVWPRPEKKEMMHNNQQPFHSLRCDAKTGVVELEQLNFKMRFQLEPAENK